MSILITGGAGYIGSVTTELLRARGEPVVVLDNLSRGHHDSVAGPARGRSIASRGKRCEGSCRAWLAAAASGPGGNHQCRMAMAYETAGEASESRSLTLGSMKTFILVAPTLVVELDSVDEFTKKINQLRGR